jgi:alanine racemase
MNPGKALDVDLAHLPFDSALQLSTSRSWLEIDLEALSTNIEALRDLSGKDVAVLLPVKADGYGHGAVEVAKEASVGGVKWFGVASLEEALILQQGGIREKILLLTPPLGHDLKYLIHTGIRPVVVDSGIAELLDDAARGEGVIHPVHLEIDTGMGRTGAPWQEAMLLIREVARLPNLLIEGIFSHFSSADEEDLSFSRIQLDRFRQLLDVVNHEISPIPIVHISNSAAALRIPEVRFPMIRPGLFIYGVSPLDPGVDGSHPRPVPAMSFRSRVVSVKEVEAGEPIGYNRAFVTTGRTRIATVSAGYGDGIDYRMSNRGEVLIRERRCSIVGNICMDLLMVDVSSVQSVSPGDRVTFLGSDGPERIGATEIARTTASIPYDVMTRFGKRVPRIYHRQGHPIKIMSFLGSWSRCDEEDRT